VVVETDEVRPEVAGGMIAVPGDPGVGGCEGKGNGGKPEVTVLGCIGIHATPPGPTTTIVDMPSIAVVIVDVPVKVVNGASVEAVKVTSVVLDPSMAVIVITVLEDI
jgi:hypothetical protein